MKTLQSSYTVPGVFVLLLSAVLLSLASCGGGGGGGGGGGDDSKVADNSPPDTPPPDVTPPPIIEPEPLLAISAGWVHTCAIVEGKAWCWGKNANGQLGNNSTDESNLPVAVVQTPAVTTVGSEKDAVLLDSGVSAISAGVSHTCAIQEGAAFCWGSNTNRRLGNSYGTSNVAVPISTLGSGVTAISAGDRHTCAIHAGKAWCWGSMLNGRLGNNIDATSVNTFSGVPMAVMLTAETTTTIGGTTTTTAATFMEGDVDAIISAGRDHTCAVHLEQAYCWGNGDYGRLGNDTTDHKSLATLVGAAGSMLDSGVTSISTGSDHTCAIHNTASGDEDDAFAAKCWGRNNRGQLGREFAVSSTTVLLSQSDIPVQVTGLENNVTAISAATNHTCAVQAGKAWCWGDEKQDQLGVTDALSPKLSYVPLAVEITDGGPQLSGVTDISVGQFHTCALLDTGVVQCWGGNGNGQLGVGALEGGDATTFIPQTLSFK